MFRFKIPYIFICLCFLVSGCAQRIANINSSGEQIICFGNSITKGEGSSPGNDYPALLSKELDMEVINAGVNGDSTRDALHRIKKDVLKKNPRLVIVELSGNDFLQGIPKQETFSNLDKIVSMIQEQGAMVILAEVRVEYFQDEDIKAFKGLAKKRQALLIPNILGGILLNPELTSSDQLHPNDTGYRVIAEKVYRAIKPLLH